MRKIFRSGAAPIDLAKRLPRRVPPPSWIPDDRCRRDSLNPASSRTRGQQPGRSLRSCLEMIASSQRLDLLRSATRISRGGPIQHLRPPPGHEMLGASGPIVVSRVRPTITRRGHGGPARNRKNLCASSNKLSGPRGPTVSRRCVPAFRRHGKGVKSIDQPAVCEGMAVPSTAKASRSRRRLCPHREGRSRPGLRGWRQGGRKRKGKGGGPKNREGHWGSPSKGAGCPAGADGSAPPQGWGHHEQHVRGVKSPHTSARLSAKGSRPAARAFLGTVARRRLVRCAYDAPRPRLAS